MKLNRLQIVPLAALLFLASGAPVPAQKQELDVESIMEEIEGLANERRANEEKIQVDLKTWRGSEREVAANEAANEREVAAARAASDQATADVQTMISQYGGNVSQGSSGGTLYSVKCKGNSACSSQISSINARFQRLTNLVKAQKTRRANRSDLSKNIAALRTRNQYIARRTVSLRKLLAGAAAINTAKKRAACVTSCKNLPPEAGAQCLQCCWDGARCSSSLPRVKQVLKPSLSMKPRRTAKQAIEEYRKSGARRPGPKTLRTRAIPVPKLK